MEREMYEYLSFFSKISEIIENEINVCSQYWYPEPPPSILLFSRVGKALVSQMELLNEQDKVNIFRHIESGMKSENDMLATAVATGLVESLVNSTDENEDRWKDVEGYLLTESKKHALAWREFGQ